MFCWWRMLWPVTCRCSAPIVLFVRSIRTASVGRLIRHLQFQFVELATRVSITSPRSFILGRVLICHCSRDFLHAPSHGDAVVTMSNFGKLRGIQDNDQDIDLRHVTRRI